MALAHKKTKRTRRAPRSAKSKSSGLDQVLVRLDDMIRELQAMRQQLARSAVPQQPEGLTRQLFGALGHGTWDEYDMELDWKRFGEWELR